MDNESPQTQDEVFVQLFARHERELRGFVRSMGLDWLAVDDVIQNVSLVMWRKWSEFDPTTEFMQWGRVIARFEVLKYRRQLVRDRHVFREDLMELLADAADELAAQATADEHRAALQACLNVLPEKSGRFIRAAYAGNRSLREVAGDLGQSATAFYKTLDRIRSKLRQCVRQRLNAT